MNRWVHDRAFPSPRTVAVICAALLVAACGGGGGGSSSPPEPPPPPPVPDPQYRASSTSPFVAGCDGAVATGTLYVNAEVEPFVAANPANASNLVGVWQQDRWSNGGARGNLAASSFDGGRTWAASMAAFSRCTGGNAGNGGDFERAHGPVGVDRSRWHRVSDRGRFFRRREQRGIDECRARQPIARWRTQLEHPGVADPGRRGELQRQGIDHRGSRAGGKRVRDLGPAVVVGTRPDLFQSHDGQRIHVGARAIHLRSGRRQPDDQQSGRGARERHARHVLHAIRRRRRRHRACDARDRPLDRQGPHVVGAHRRVARAVGRRARSRERHTGARRLESRRHRRGTAGGSRRHVAGCALLGGARDAIALSRSTDGGLTWSTPARINADPTVAAFEPSVTVRHDGTIGVAYYDFRSNTTDRTTLPTDYWIARSSDGITWRESRVAGPFDLAIAPNAGGLFVGDYQGLVSIGEIFVPFYSTTNNGDVANRTDIFASLVSSIGAAAQAARVAEARPPMRAPTAAPLAASPELARELTASIARTMLRRVPGSTPAWLDRTAVDAP